ncbi:MAG: endoglucanase A [Nannocystis sp.]|nr:glycoside hydrolase family 44 protein [Nannocystis sp.]MBA3545860.1 endoglucanase A [Nannocystis sp.]
MRTSINLLTGTTLALLLGCPGSGGDTDAATSNDPSGPATSSSGTTETPPTSGTSGATDPVTGTEPDPTEPGTDSTDSTDPTAGTDPTAATDTDPTGEPGPLVEPGDPGPGDVTFKIRADQDRHPISRRIYGTNQPHDLDTAQRGIGLIRQGGNRMTAYNWENNASNAGEDYMNQNDDYLASQLMVDGNIPGEVVRAPTQQALEAGADMMVTIPILGFVAADKDGGGDVNQSPNYLGTRFHQTIAAKGAPFAAMPDLGDDKVYQDEFTAWLKGKFPDAFAGDEAQILFSMDNEPDLWNATHPRIHPVNVGYVELAQKNRDFARAVKAVAPNAIVTGMVSYGFAGYQSLQAAPDKMGDAIDYYLAQMKIAGDQDGLRLIDVLDLHWYTEIYASGQRITGEDISADSVAARVQAPRSLWDPSFKESSWIANDVLQGPIRLIPWLKDKIAAHYPDTGIGFTEYNYGGGGHISGAIAQADTLGIFGREGVALAAYWSLGGPPTFIDAAFRVFTSYDDEGAHFGDTSIQAITSDVEKTSIYASVDAAAPGRTVLVAINKTGGPLTAAVTLAANADYQSVEVWQLTGAAPTLTSVPGPALADTNAFLLPLPAYSVQVVVPKP